jgi:hypothetical protein
VDPMGGGGGLSVSRLNRATEALQPAASTSDHCPCSGQWLLVQRHSCTRHVALFSLFPLHSPLLPRVEANGPALGSPAMNGPVCPGARTVNGPALPQASADTQPPSGGFPSRQAHHSWWDVRAAAALRGIRQPYRHCGRCCIYGRSCRSNSSSTSLIWANFILPTAA